MAGLFYKNATVSVIRREVPANKAQPTAADVTEKALWAGRVYMYPLSATARVKTMDVLKVISSHRCHGVPQDIDIQVEDIVQVGTKEYTVTLPTPTFTGPLGSTGWDLLLLED